jgi:RNA polymerase sigma-70 factor (ECF subfamily)
MTMEIEQRTEVSGLLERAVGGDPEAVRALFDGQRERLKRLVRLRLRRDLAGRVDESAVIDAILGEATTRLAAYAQGPRRPFALWVRDLACRRLAEIHDRQADPAGREGNAPSCGELTLHGDGLPVADASWLASRFLGEAVESRALDRAERRLYLQEALNNLEAIDREILALKHFERLGFGEIAEVLGLGRAEAGRRYLDAVRRLRAVLPWAPGQGRS